MEGLINMGRKWCDLDMMLDPLYNLELWPQPWLDIDLLDFPGKILK